MTDDNPSLRARVRPFTPLQGQYLAFIDGYTAIHGTAPSEAELQQYFGVTPPTVHQMILTLERHKFISRVPGTARSIKLLVAREELPRLNASRM